MVYVHEVSKHIKLRARVVMRRERVVRVETIRDTVRRTKLEIDRPPRTPVVQTSRDLIKHVTAHRIVQSKPPII
jgi:hypothetical protein